MWGMGSAALLMCLLHWQEDSLPLSHRGSPIIILYRKYYYMLYYCCDYFCIIITIIPQDVPSYLCRLSLVSTLHLFSALITIINQLCNPLFKICIPHEYVFSMRSGTISITFVMYDCVEGKYKWTQYVLSISRMRP